MSFANLKIFNKLAVSFALVVAIVIVMCGVLFASATQLTYAEKLNNDSDNAVDFVDQARTAQKAEAATSRGFLINQNPKFLAEFKVATATFNKSIADTRQNLDGDTALIAQLDAMKASHDTWLAGGPTAQVALASNPATRSQAAGVFGNPQSLANDAAFETSAADVSRAISTWSDGWTAKGDKAIADIKLAVIIGGTAAALAAAALGWFVARAIAKPVTAMTVAMKTLAAGDNTVEIPAAGQKDEVGEMAVAVQMFKTAAIEKIRLAGEASQIRQLADSDRARNEASNVEAARLQAVVVESLASGLEKLSQGNLVYRLEDPFAPDYEKLRADFNAAMNTLQDTMRTVATNTTTIRSGAVEISSASDDLSRRTEQQAASLEETAAALDEITATVRKTAEGSKHARTVVGSAKTDAENSGQVVQNAVIAMTGIEKSSQEIGQIIGVIDEIAFQTNLLALNAGVEAARAGDAGRGFAVVASEVRALAQRSATAAKEIKTLISMSSQQVKAGVDLVGETGKALTRIVAQVTEINGVVVEIAASAQEQATALNEVNSAVNQMDQVTQQNAAMVEQATAASQSLSQETEELARLIGKFQVGDTAGGHAPARKAARANATVQVMKTMGSGGAARKAAAHAGSWEEF